jgi:hypothetical protein
MFVHSNYSALKFTNPIPILPVLFPANHKLLSSPNWSPHIGSTRLKQCIFAFRNPSACDRFSSPSRNSTCDRSSRLSYSETVLMATQNPSRQRKFHYGYPPLPNPINLFDNFTAKHHASTTNFAATTCFPNWIKKRSFPILTHLQRCKAADQFKSLPNSSPNN